MNVEILFRRLPRSETLETIARRNANRLGRLHRGVSGCVVVIEPETLSRHSGRRYRVHVRVTVPGRELVVDRTPRDAHTDGALAVRDAFRSMRRHLSEHVRARRKRRTRGHVSLASLNPAFG